jgi:predicted PP-loop superfamily ATPase
MLQRRGLHNKKTLDQQPSMTFSGDLLQKEHPIRIRLRRYECQRVLNRTRNAKLREFSAMSAWSFGNRMGN